MSGDGRYVAFVAGDPTGESQGGLLYVRDLQTNSTKVITPETINNGWEWTPFTDNGQIAFVSSESTLVPGDTNGYPDVFVEDLATGAIDRVNLTPSGEQESGNSIGNVNASRIAISRDGRYVAFWSASANMGVAPNNTAIFLRDRVAGTTELASVLPFSYPFCFGEGIQGVSNDGRYVSFNEDCEPDDGINNPAIYGTFVRDRTLGTTTQVDTLPDGMPTNGFSYVSVMSADGNWIAYESDATNLLTNDTNNTADMFMHKLG
jgi:Tol biopolymer transport system component